MATLKEDIKTQSDWIVNAFRVDGYNLDGTMDSIIEVDRFFKQNMEGGKPKKNRRLSGQGYGNKLFSIRCVYCRYNNLIK